MGSGPYHKEIIGQMGFRAICKSTPVDVWFQTEIPKLQNHDGSKTDSEIEGHSLVADFLYVSRHPYILQLLGTVTLREGPAFITERSACSIANALNSGSIPRVPALRIMYQISTALAYIHDLGVCHCSVKAESVYLMQSVLIDPIAKLSNFSKCKTKSMLFVEDIADFTDLLCIVTCWPNSVRKSDAEFVKSPAPKPSADDTESFPLLAHLIEVARDGSVAAKEVAKILSEIDAKIRVRSSSPHVSDSESGRIAFQSGQDGHGAWLDDVKRCGGCFSLPLARVE